MASNFSSLRTARKTALDKLNAEIKKENQKGAVVRRTLLETHRRPEDEDRLRQVMRFLTGPEE
jgi:hypothetical protein